LNFGLYKCFGIQESLDYFSSSAVFSSFKNHAYSFLQMVQTSFNLTHPSNYMLSAITGTVGALGLPGNAFLAVMILLEYKKRKPHEWLLFFLALNDFLLCLNNVTLEAPFIIRFDRVECKVAGVIDYIFGTMSFMTPPLVAYNRYLRLYDALKYTKVFTNRNVVCMWLAILGFGFSWILPFAFTDSLGQDDMGLCGIQIKNMTFAALLLAAATVLVSSYVVLLFFSIKVIARIRVHKKHARSSSNLQSRLINETQELITVMLLISAVPLFAQIPAAVTKMLQSLLDPFDPWISRSVIAPFPLTAASNAYITLYIVRDYRKKVIKFFRFFFTN
jgi:hypothetical protein